ncbi:hypothetical protein OG250_31905 [Streptomyces sp. NBC_00487]|uniref:hypothetical protein n=1 Tax=unclassified Streptomyces TaxID=2593676 RepID=UPI002DDBE70B|nr:MULTISPECIES: hypothetical protein [unclassified Streptomyces]WRY98989.1 hypothetical protein OG889_32465 [Streptomyces sp. NBC_00481]
MKRSIATRAKAGAFAAALLVSGVGLGLATGSPASAATCYGGAVQFTKLIDHTVSQMFTTSSACQDINLKITNSPSDSTREVKVCFYRSDNTLNYCQASFRLATLDRWAVIATDVNDNVKYRYAFESSRSVTAYTAD